MLKYAHTNFEVLKIMQTNTAVQSKQNVYLSNDIVILTLKEYQELHTAKCILQGKADIKAGNFCSLDEFEQHTKNKIAEWENK